SWGRLLHRGSGVDRAGYARATRIDDERTWAVDGNRRCRARGWSGIARLGAGYSTRIPATSSAYLSESCSSSASIVAHAFARIVTLKPSSRASIPDCTMHASV